MRQMADVKSDTTPCGRLYTGAATKPWIKNNVDETLQTRRRLQLEDTAVLLLEIPLHDASDTEFTQRMIASIKTIVDELQIFVKNVLVPHGAGVRGHNQTTN